MYQQPTHQFQKLLIRTESQMGGIGENEWLVLGAVQCRTLNFGFLAFFLVDCLQMEQQRLRGQN